MKILAVDTAARTCSVALGEDGQVLYELVLNLGLTHSETMQLACDRALEALGWRYQELDAFAVTQGPGSFTGLRIGMTAVKTFAYVTGKKALGFSSLAVLAEPYVCAADTAVLSLLDARHRRVYAGLYQNGLALAEERLGDIDLYLPLLVAACAERGIKQVILAGDCSTKYYEDEAVLGYLHERKIHICLRGDTEIRAAALARLAMQALAQDPSAGQNPAELAPLYLTATEAERGANFYV